MVDGKDVLAPWRAVSPDYFNTLGIGMERGRQFLKEDSTTTPAVAIVNTTLAKHLWPGESSLGKQIHVGTGSGTFCEIVGVVDDSNHNIRIHNARVRTVFATSSEIGRDYGGHSSDDYLYRALHENKQRSVE